MGRASHTSGDMWAAQGGWFRRTFWVRGRPWDSALLTSPRNWRGWRSHRRPSLPKLKNPQGVEHTFPIFCQGVTGLRECLFGEWSKPFPPKGKRKAMCHWGETSSGRKLCSFRNWRAPWSSTAYVDTWGTGRLLGHWRARCRGAQAGTGTKWLSLSHFFLYNSSSQAWRTCKNTDYFSDSEGVGRGRERAFLTSSQQLLLLVQTTAANHSFEIKRLDETESVILQWSTNLFHVECPDSDPDGFHLQLSGLCQTLARMPVLKQLMIPLLQCNLLPSDIWHHRH